MTQASRRCLAAIGTFDGVHKGHRILLRRLMQQAKRLGLRTLVVLFSEPPRFYFRPEQATPLITLPLERKEILLASGIDEVRILRFGKFWAEMSHIRFFEDFLIKRCRIKGLAVGPDFAFGKGRQGSVPWLQHACRSRHIHLHVEPLLVSDAVKISSTRIRELLLHGDVEKAGQLLSRPYFLTGSVIRGQGLGRTIGVPTANLNIDPKKLLPRGVYKVRVSGPDPKFSSPLSLQGRGQGGERGIGVCNIGTRPTVGGKSRIHIEVHIPGFSGSLYGQKMKIEFLKHLRPEKKFPSLNTLKAQIQRDIRRAIHP